MRAANIYITLNIYAILVLAILLIVCWVQRKNSTLINRYFIGWVLAHILMLCCDCLRWDLRGRIDTLPLFVLFYFGEYTFGYTCLLLFHFYMIDLLEVTVGVDRRLRFLTVPISVIMPILWIISYRNRMFYTITYNAVNVPNQAYYISQLPAMMLIAFDMILVFSQWKKLGLKIMFSLLLPIIFPMVAFPLESNWNAQILFISLTLSILTRFAMITSEQNRLLAESRARLAEDRIAIAMSQIRPHFLYNVLGSISVLCDENARRARDAIDYFAGYLRINLATVERSTPIPFKTELDHTKTYIWLEKLRFGDKLQISYDISTENFMVPALSVQPIVENAVKHGICAKESGGRINIRVHETKNTYIIQVQDDGVGFRVENVASCDNGRVHIGIKNVKSRLEGMVDGTLVIQSVPGEGTEATISIPKRKGKT